MLWLAYDGSLNADWLSHYAIHFARHLPERSMRVLFVEDGSLPAHDLSKRLHFVERESHLAGVKLVVERLAAQGNVARALIDRIPAGPDSYVVCGTRIRQRNLSFLTGTVSEKLLAAKRFNVLALRIVQPALLGLAHRLLVPVMGHPRGFDSGLPFLKLLGPNVERLHVLMVQAHQVGRTRFVNGAPLIDPSSAALQYVRRIEGELRPVLPSTVKLEGSVVLAPDPPAEIVLAAKQHRSQLIYLGASERSLAKRLFEGAPYETVLKHTPCDVGIYRGIS